MEDEVFVLGRSLACRKDDCNVWPYTKFLAHFHSSGGCCCWEDLDIFHDDYRYFGPWIWLERDIHLECLHFAMVVDDTEMIVLVRIGIAVVAAVAVEEVDLDSFETR